MPYIGVSPTGGVRKLFSYTATAGQTSFSGSDNNSQTLSYSDSNFIDVFQNGVLLLPSDYTATTGTSVVLDTGATVSDSIQITVFDVFSAADTVSKADGGTFDGNVTMAGTLAVTGETTLATHLNMGDSDKIKLGASGDLEIYHDGSNSHIDDTGTGVLVLRGNSKVELQKYTGEVMLTANADGAVDLYHDDSKKFETTSSGIIVNNKLQGASGESLTIESQSGGAVIFNSNGANERMRITSAGNVGIGMSPNGKLEVKETAVATIANFYNTHSSTPYGIYIDFSSGSPDDNSSYAFRFEDSTTDRCIIYSDGDIYNHDGTYAAISDERIKDNITNAKSQWDDIKAMRFVNYQRKDDILQYGKEDAKVQLGLIGQEVEKVSPNLVRQVEPNASDIRHSSEFGTLYEDGDDIPNDKAIGDVKEVKDKVKGVAYSILYMKAVKALQEAMTRIETLEAKVTALEKGE